MHKVKRYKAICIKQFIPEDSTQPKRADVLDVITFERHEINCIRALLKTSKGKKGPYWFVDDIQKEVSKNQGEDIVRRSFWTYFKELKMPD